MDSGALTILEYCFLALVYLFLFRVVRTVLAELKPGRIPVPAAAVAEAAPVAAMAPSRREKSGRRWELVIVEPSSRSGESFSLGEELSVGRGAGCAVVLADDTFVSTVHARIFIFLAQRGIIPNVEDAAIKDVVARYVDARDRKDVRATEALFSVDADQLVSSGEWRKGRDAVVKGTMASSEASGGKRTITVERVRFLTPDVALADGRYEIAGTNGADARRMWSTFLMTRTAEGWKISAIRNMLPAAPAAPAK